MRFIRRNLLLYAHIHEHKLTQTCHDASQCVSFRSAYIFYLIRIVYLVCITVFVSISQSFIDHIYVLTSVVVAVAVCWFPFVSYFCWSLFFVAINTIIFFGSFGNFHADFEISKCVLSLHNLVLCSFEFFERFFSSRVNSDKFLAFARKRTHIHANIQYIQRQFHLLFSQNYFNGISVCSLYLIFCVHVD